LDFTDAGTNATTFGSAVAEDEDEEALAPPELDELVELLLLLLLPHPRIAAAHSSEMDAELSHLRVTI
jgi:hypothetical protein